METTYQTSRALLGNFNRPDQPDKDKLLRIRQARGGLLLSDCGSRSVSKRVQDPGLLRLHMAPNKRGPCPVLRGLGQNKKKAGPLPLLVSKAGWTGGTNFRG